MKQTIQLPLFWESDIDLVSPQINELEINVSEEHKDFWVSEIPICVSYAKNKWNLSLSQITIKLFWIDEKAEIKNFDGEWKLICHGAKYIHIDKSGITLDGIFKNGELLYIDDVYEAILNLEES